MFIAHRGKVTSSILENTIESIDASIKDIRYSGFECDIRQTIDKEFVLCHDLTYKNKIIKYTKLKDLKELGITTLKEVLSLSTSKIMLLEIKDFNMDLKKLSILLNNANKNIYVMSFSKDVIKKIKIYAKNFKCGVLNYLFNSEKSYKNFDFVALLNSTINDDIYKYFNSKGIALFSYGIVNLHKKYLNIYYIVDNDSKYMLQ